MSGLVLDFPEPPDHRGSVSGLIEDLYASICRIGSEDDDDVPGYRLLPQTRDELRQVAELLREALELLENVEDREDPRWNDAYDRAHPDETPEALDAKIASELEVRP